MWKRWWILGAVGVVIAVALVVWLVVLRDTTTPLTAADLGFTGVAGDAPGEPGIYRYATTGFEEIDALGGARHDYPAVTYLVIESGVCGPIVRWFAIAERWFETVHCGPDLGVTASTNYHEWFHIPDRGESTCTAPIFPPDGKTTWTVVCDDEAMSSTDQVTLVGMETLDVGGIAVDTVHTRTVSTTTGSSVATTTTDEWRLPGTALVARKVFHDESANDTRVGKVNYVEDFTVQLQSLLPTG